jgi:hypothetical protein
MADKTLIQGAQNIANARNTSGIGQAFGLGLDKSIAQQREARAAQAKQARKNAEAIQKRTEKYLNEWDGTNINNGELSEGQMAKVHEAAAAIQKDYAAASNKQAKDPNNMDLINERKGYLQEMKNLKLAFDDYADGFGVWELGVDGKLYSKSAANIGNLGLNEQAYTEPVVWDRESKSLVLPNSRGEDGKALLYKDVNLPFTDGNDAAKIISDKAGELSGPRKNNLSDFQIKNNSEEIKSLILASNPAEGINNMPALLANGTMLSLFPEWENIEYAATMTDDQKEAVADEMANVVMSRYKSVAEAATGVTPPPRGFQETPTNQAWIRDTKKLAKGNVATEIQAPNGDYVVIIPKGVEYEGFKAKEPMMRIVNGVDANGNPIYQLRPLEQGLIQTKKRK